MMARVRSLQRVLPGSRKKNQPRVFPGLPPGLDVDLIQQICCANFSAPYRTIQYSPISGVFPWKKAACVCRIQLNLEDGRKRTLIYKRGTYTHQNTSVYSDLPSIPGPFEYDFYTFLSPYLEAHLPKVYFTHADGLEENYQFILEDLCPAHHRISDPMDFIRLAGWLPEFHERLQVGLSILPGEAIPVFDPLYMLALFENIDRKLGSCFSKNSGRGYTEFIEIWPDIAQILRSSWVYDLQPQQLIHGDFHASNIYLFSKNARDFKVIDWQFAGKGFPQMDLAAVLKSVDTVAEQEALREVEKQYPERQAIDHRRVYLWCKLFRYVIDSANMAIEITDDQTTPSILASKNLDRYLRLTIGSVSEYRQFCTSNPIFPNSTRISHNER